MNHAVWLHTKIISCKTPLFIPSKCESKCIICKNNYIVKGFQDSYSCLQFLQGLWWQSTIGGLFPGKFTVSVKNMCTSTLSLEGSNIEDSPSSTPPPYTSFSHLMVHQHRSFPANSDYSVPHHNPTIFPCPNCSNY